MISLTDLNTPTTLSFTDNRPYGIVTNINYGKTVTQQFTSNTFTIINTAIIEEIIGGASANVRFEINTADPTILPSISGFPPGVTLLTVGTKSTFSGIDSISDYNIVKAAHLTIPTEYFGSFSYSVAIIWNTPTGANNRISWQVNAFKAEVALNSSFSISCQPNANFVAKDIDLEFGFNMFDPVFNETVWDVIDSFDWAVTDTTIDVSPTPQVLDVPFGLTYWCVTVESSEENKLSNITSTTEAAGLISSSFSSGVYTIVGSRADINTTLTGLRITIDGSATKGDFNLTYKAFTSNDTNTVPGIDQFQYTLFQVANNTDADILTPPTSGTVTFDPDVNFDINNLFTVVDGLNDGTGTYTLTITPDTDSVRYIYGVSIVETSWNGTVYTASGTRDEINNVLSNTYIDPNDDPSGFDATFAVENPDEIVGTHDVTFAVGTTAADTNGNFSLEREYSTTLPKILFNGDEPEITDLDQDHFYPEGTESFFMFIKDWTKGTRNVATLSEGITSDEFDWTGITLDTDTPYTFTPGRSLQFNESFITVAPDSTIDLSGNFTIDFWVKITDVTGGAEKIIDTRSEGTSVANSLFIDFSDSKLRIFIDNTDQADYSVSSNTWYFITVHRKGSRIEAYVGDTLVFSYLQSTVKDYSLTTDFYIGANGEDQSNHRLTGFIDDFRIRNGSFSTPTIPTIRPIDDDDTVLLLYFDVDVPTLRDREFDYTVTLDSDGGPGFSTSEFGTYSTPKTFAAATKTVINETLLPGIYVDDDPTDGGPYTVTVSIQKEGFDAIIFTDTFSLVRIS